jgi:hypothetical protein
MSLAFFVYLASIVQGLKLLLILPGTILLVLLPCIMFFNTVKEKETTNKKWFIIPAAIMLFLGSLIPSERAMYMMAGAYAAQSVYESPATQRISGKIIDLIDEKLNNELKVLKEAK